MFSGKNKTQKKYFLPCGGITAEVTEKKIRHMYLRVCAYTGDIKISAPEGIGREKIRSFLDSRTPWIKARQAGPRREKKPAPDFKTGDKVYCRGKSFLLNVIERPGPPEVCAGASGRLMLYISCGSSSGSRGRAFDEWYRQRLTEDIPPVIRRWEKILNVRVKLWRVRKMKTRWGTCSVHDSRVWFNLELAKKPPELLEYIVVHELLHLIEPGHTVKYRGLMDEFMPDWRLRKEKLDRFPG